MLLTTRWKVSWDNQPFRTSFSASHQASSVSIIRIPSVKSLFRRSKRHQRSVRHFHSYSMEARPRNGLVSFHVPSIRSDRPRCKPSLFHLPFRIHSFVWLGTLRRVWISPNVRYFIRSSFPLSKAHNRKWAHPTVVRRSFSRIRQRKFRTRQWFFTGFSQHRPWSIIDRLDHSSCLQWRRPIVERASRKRWRLQYWCLVSIFTILPRWRQ